VTGHSGSQRDADKFVDEIELFCKFGKLRSKASVFEYNGFKARVGTRQE
jgi:hypothetical protein